jgi:hypothetical protein
MPSHWGLGLQHKRGRYIQTIAILKLHFNLVIQLFFVVVYVNSNLRDSGRYLLLFEIHLFCRVQTPAEVQINNRIAKGRERQSVSLDSFTD